MASWTVLRRTGKRVEVGQPADPRCAIYSGMEASARASSATKGSPKVSVR
jgi:hypothetical protein